MENTESTESTIQRFINYCNLTSMISEMEQELDFQYEKDVDVKEVSSIIAKQIERILVYLHEKIKGSSESPLVNSIHEVHQSLYSDLQKHPDFESLKQFFIQTRQSFKELKNLLYKSTMCILQNCIPDETKPDLKSRSFERITNNWILQRIGLAGIDGEINAILWILHRTQTSDSIKEYIHKWIHDDIMYRIQGPHAQEIFIHWILKSYEEDEIEYNITEFLGAASRYINRTLEYINYS